MIVVRNIGIFLLCAVIGAFCAAPIGRHVPARISGFVATLEAVIGHPLTPTSVAGVSRRTARRCEGAYC